MKGSRVEGLPEPVSWKENERAVLAFTHGVLLLLVCAYLYVAYMMPALRVQLLMTGLLLLAGWGVLLAYRRAHPEVREPFPARGRVTKAIPQRGLGLVTMARGGMWEARSLDAAGLACGMDVQVVARRGVVVYVRRVA